MSALVPYGAAGAVQLYRKRKRVKVAMAVAKYGWKNRKGIARGIRASYKTYRKVTRKPRRSKFQPQEQSGKARAYQQATIGNNFGCNQRKLYLQDFINPYTQSGTDGVTYGTRFNQSVVYSGYKVCRTFENGLQTVNDKYMVHYAIIQWGAASTTSTAALKTNFFRDNQNITKTTSDFADAVTVGSELFDLKYNCCPMNPKNGYKIITHRKRILLPKTLDTIGRNIWKIEFYLPIKKRMGFEQSGVDQPTQRFSEVWWYQPVVESDWDVVTPGLKEAIDTNHSHVLYFKPTKGA